VDEQVSTRSARLAASAVSLVLVVAVGAGVFHAIFEIVSDRGRASAVAKLAVALAAIAFLVVERRLPRARGRGVLLGLGALAILAHVGEYKPGPKLVHFWDQYHYYMGAKWFPEIGYGNLYRCALVAEAELGTLETRSLARGEIRRVDLAAEARDPARRIRDIEATNLLAYAKDLGVHEHPERCKARFSPERWEAYKADVRFFRITAGKAAWEDMQKDHGFNPPPVWMVAGRLLAGDERASLDRMQLLGLVDFAYLAGMFVALWWAFGWRVCAVGAIVWGGQAAATFLWTAGAFLRQDWLFFTVFSMCLVRRRHLALGGASLAYAALLRVFPAVIAIGWVVIAARHLVRHRRLHPDHARVLAGGLAAAGALVGLSLLVCGPNAYHEFARRTLGVHNQTWTSNLMGSSIVVAYATGIGAADGRLEDALDRSKTDASEGWRTARAARFAAARPIAIGLAVAGLAFLAWTVRRLRSLWIAGCLGQLAIVLLSQIACYYYAFLVLAAPLTRARRDLELPIFAFAAATQVASLLLPWPDDRYAALSLLTTLFCLGLVAAFRRRAA
jgi:hypothetical protein